MTKLILFTLPLLAACASTQTAKQLRYIGYEDTPSAQKSIGTIEGRDCSWSVLGYSLGEPTVRSAFMNAAAQKDAGYVAGMQGDSKGEKLKSIRNVSVEDDGFNAWIVGRRCVVVNGEGVL